jgi:hypothetical protein
MPIPTLIHPISVYLRKSDKTNTAVMDSLLHEPVGQVRRETSIKLRAQVLWGLDHTQQPSDMTVAASSDGYLLFLTADLVAAHVTLNIGDRIIKIGEGAVALDVDLYIVSFRWMGHYPGQRGPTLVRAYFADRSPSRQR